MFGIIAMSVLTVCLFICITNKIQNSNAVFSQQQQFREPVHQQNVIKINAKHFYL